MNRMKLNELGHMNNIKERAIRFYQEKPLEFSLLLTFLYALIVYYGVLHHEMSRDEIQAWLIAKESGGILDLLKNLKYEGHPGLWHFMLFIISRFSTDPFFMQVLHAAIASLCVFLFVRYSPFGLAFKLLFPFGALPLYHYSVLCRNYSMGMLFSFAVCVLYGKRFEKFPLIVFFLILLANSNVYGLMLSGSFMLIFVCEHFANSLKFTSGKLYSDAPGSEPGRYAMFYPCVLAYVILIAAEIIQLIPPADIVMTEFDAGSGFFHLSFVASRILVAYMPVFAKLAIVNSNFLKLAGALLGLSLLIFFLAVLRRRIYSFIFLFSSTVSILLVIDLIYFGFFRHHANLFIALLASLWIASIYGIGTITDTSIPSQNFGNPDGVHSGRLKTAADTILLLFFIAHVIAGVYAYSLDIQKNYSMAKEVSAYVRREGLDALPVIASQDFAGTSLAGYMRKKIYYPEIRREGSFTVWNRERASSIDWRRKEKEILNIATDRTRLEGREELLITNFPLDLKADYARALKDVNIVFLKDFTGGIVFDENYWMYKISPHGSTRH